jgi:hypothetical protein
MSYIQWFDQLCVAAPALPLQVHTLMAFTALVAMWFVNSALTIGYEDPTKQ